MGLKRSAGSPHLTVTVPVAECIPRDVTGAHEMWVVQEVTTMKERSDCKVSYTRIFFSVTPLRHVPGCLIFSNRTLRPAIIFIPWFSGTSEISRTQKRHGFFHRFTTPSFYGSPPPVRYLATFAPILTSHLRNEPPGFSFTFLKFLRL